MALTRPRYSQIYDTDYKQSVRLATTTNVGNLLTSGNVVSSVDGVSVSVNDRILVKNQTDAKQNGIYRVVTVGSGTDGTWIRTQDADNVGNGKVTSGMTTTVTEGSTNANKTFKLTTVDPIVVGTTELTFNDPFTAAAGGANTQVQFNDLGSVSGSSAFTFDKSSNVLTISGNISAGNILTSNILYPNGSPYLIGGGTVSISSSNTAPVSPTVGDFWYDTEEDILFQYIDDGANDIWVDLSGDPAQVVAGTPNKQFYANKVQIGTSQYLLDTFPAAGNTLVAWTVSAKDNVGNNIRSSTIHSVNDGTDVYWTEYGIIQSNSSVNVVTFNSNISSGNVRLYTTGDSINVSVTFQRLLLGSDTTTGYIMGGTAGPSGATGTIENTSGIIKTTNTSISTSSTTGALQVAGGAGIGGNVYIQSGHQFNIGADLANLTIAGNILSLDLSPMHVLSNADANNRIIVQNINSGSNASSGITFVADNGSISNNFFDVGINNSLNDDGILYRNDGFLHVIGGNIMMGALTLDKNIHFHIGDMTTEDHMVGMFDANSFHVMKSTVSTSTTTGALRVHGGVGIEGNVYAGNITATYLYGNGSQLTGIVTGSSYGNTEVAAYLLTYTGNVSAGNLSAGTTTIDGNLTVNGNLIVNGNTTIINANNLSINDSMIYLAEENPADTLDIGITAHVVNPSLNHVGFVRDASDSTWKLFSNVATQPATTVDFTGAIYANLQIGNLISPSVYSASSGNVNLNLYSSGTGQTYVRQSTGGAYGLNLAQDIVTSGSSARLYFLGSGGHTAIYNSGGTLFFNTASSPGTSSGFPQVKIAPTGTAVNWLQLTGSATGNAVPIAVDGTDSNINLTLSAKGSGNITTANSVVISNASASTSTTSGALRVSGGAGIAGNVYTGGNISTAGYFLGNGSQLTGLPSSYGNTEVASYLPTYSGVLGSSNLQVTGGGTFSGTLTIGAGGFINSAGNIISGGNIRDSKGDVRAAPINSQMMSYTVLATDAGKTIVESFSSAAITFNASVLVAGDMVSVVNTSAGTITLVQGAGVTLRLAGTATTGTRTLASNGVATVICTVGGGTPTFYCSGAGLT